MAFIKNHTVCGMDEAGRGALAGPLVAAAVILPHTMEKNLFQSGIVIRDSKTLSRKQRNAVMDLIQTLKITYFIYVSRVTTINAKGIGWTNRNIFIRLLTNVKPCDKVIIDGNYRITSTNHHVTSVPHADRIIPAVILAGIVAKVTRDTFMKRIGELYPEYVWHKNAGYGTEEHIKAIIMHGVCRYHRNIFVSTALKHKTIPMI